MFLRSAKTQTLAHVVSERSMLRAAGLGLTVRSRLKLHRHKLPAGKRLLFISRFVCDDKDEVACSLHEGLGYTTKCGLARE